MQHPTAPSGGPRLPGGFAPLHPGDPRVIGPFRVVGRIGAGGMGAVYGALGESGERVAVKVIHPRYAQDPGYRERFAREAGLLARVDAECAPAFLGADPQAETPWLATDFVPGRTLKEHVAEVGPLGGRALLSFAAGTAEALAAVHAAGVVHRDVKPANVMLSPTGPRVLDFGIARAAEDARPEERTYGTPGWVAPERLDGGPDSPRSDVFAWGGLVVYAATGRGPFGGGTADELLERARAGAPDLSGVPDELLPVVRAALDRDPARRPDAGEAMRAVLALAGEAEEAGAERDPRARLRALITDAWTGFTDAGRGAGPWVAAASVASLGAGGAVGGALGGGSVGGGAAAPAAAGAVKAAGSSGLIGGVSTATAITSGAVLLTAVVTGSWVAGRVATEQPIIPGTSASASPSAEAPAEEETQRVEFGALTLEVPADWTVHRYQREYQALEATGPTEAETVVLGTDPDTECAEPQGNFGYYGCPHVELHGEAGIAVGSAAFPVTADLPYAPPTEPYSCDQPLNTTEVPPPEETGGLPQDPSAAETVDVDGVPAAFRVWTMGCYDNGTQQAPSTEGPYATFEQRYWLMEEIGVIVVDNHETPGLDEIMADAEVAA